MVYCGAAHSSPAVEIHIDQWEDEELFPVDLYRKVFDVGLVGLEYPKAYGGIPCDKFMNKIFLDRDDVNIPYRVKITLPMTLFML
jgi:alkylation response protein AidB-like acyl-CoA dehydrogenase